MGLRGPRPAPRGQATPPAAPESAQGPRFVATNRRPALRLGASQIKKIFRRLFAPLIRKKADFIKTEIAAAHVSKQKLLSAGATRQREARLARHIRSGIISAGPPLTLTLTLTP